MKIFSSQLVKCALFSTLFGASFLFVSCDNDDPDPIPIDSAFDTKFVYSAEFSADLLLVADVVAVYQDAAGAQKSEPVTTTAWTKTFESELLPTTTGVVFNITKKSNFDASDASQKDFKISRGLNWDITVKGKQTGGIVLTEKDGSSSSATVTADNLDIILAKINEKGTGWMVSVGADKDPVCKETSIDWKFLKYIPKFNITTTLSPDLLEIAEVRWVAKAFSRGGDIDGTWPINTTAWSDSLEGPSLPAILGFKFEFIKRADIDPAKTEFVIVAGATMVVSVKGETGGFVPLKWDSGVEGINQTIGVAEIDDMINQLNSGSWVLQITPDKSLKPAVIDLDLDYEDLTAFSKK